MVVLGLTPAPDGSDLGYTTGAPLETAFESQMTPLSEARSCRASRRRAIGMLYVDLGMITRPQLNHALVECARAAATLPETLRRLGYL